MINEGSKKMRGEPTKLFRKGEVIFSRNQIGENAFIVERGTVGVFLKDANGKIKNVVERGEGAIIGEMALIDAGIRTASVKALTDCHLIEITKTDFESRLGRSDTLVQLVMQVLLSRYRNLLEKNRNVKETYTLEGPERSVSAELRKEFKITESLESAIKNGELSLVYQPMLNIHVPQVMGFEALTRWKDYKTGKFIPPDIFIPLAEGSGLITQLNMWAFTQACQTLAHLYKKYGPNNRFFMSVNFSSEDFLDPHLDIKLKNILEKFKIDAEDIHIEITERLLISKPETAKQALEKCHKAGMQVSIDDFGTGYSSLSYLHSYPIDILKIDRSFIMKLNEDASVCRLVRSIIDLGHNLGMKIVAEGVEVQAEVQALKGMSSDFVQGYYYSKPLDFDHLNIFLDTYNVS